MYRPDIDRGVVVFGPGSPGFRLLLYMMLTDPHRQFDTEPRGKSGKHPILVEQNISTY